MGQLHSCWEKSGVAPEGAEAAILIARPAPPVLADPGAYLHRVGLCLCQNGCKRPVLHFGHLALDHGCAAVVRSTHGGRTGRRSCAGFLSYHPQVLYTALSSEPTLPPSHLIHPPSHTLLTASNLHQSCVLVFSCFGYRLQVTRRRLFRYTNVRPSVDPAGRPSPVLLSRVSCRPCLCLCLCFCFCFCFCLGLASTHTHIYLYTSPNPESPTLPRTAPAYVPALVIITSRRNYSSRWHFPPGGRES